MDTAQRALLAVSQLSEGETGQQPPAARRLAENLVEHPLWQRLAKAIDEVHDAQERVAANPDDAEAVASQQGARKGLRDACQMFSTTTQNSRILGLISHGELQRHLNQRQTVQARRRLLNRQLEDLVVTGKGDTSQADKLREELRGLERDLRSPLEREGTRQWGADRKAMDYELSIFEACMLGQGDRAEAILRKLETLRRGTGAAQPNPRLIGRREQAEFIERFLAIVNKALAANPELAVLAGQPRQEWARLAEACAKDLQSGDVWGSFNNVVRWQRRAQRQVMTGRERAASDRR
jgi:hypothetical protein